MNTNAAIDELRTENVYLNLKVADLETTVEELKAQLAEARATKNMHKESNYVPIADVAELLDLILRLDPSSHERWEFLNKHGDKLK